jgi:filamentous hemagglutinin
MSSTTVKKHKKHPQRFILRPLAVSLLGFLASASVWSDGIVADPNAPRGQQPTVLQSNNGLPVVNIQTPTRAGVSVNQYRQFDVGEKGAVLNNSHRNVQTQLGGWIQGNPWLARGEARVIVNQVNSADPSRLNGYVEIGGRRADLVIANPAGINVNGGGFINANQVTLGAGNAVIQDGRYTGIAQGVGSLNIAGGGLDASRNDYTNLIANAVNVNGGIWANRLSVQAGGTSADTAAQPNTFAIDTGALGGMYAGTIHLMVNGAEQNSIRNAGQIFARAGEVRLDAAGNVVNSGSIVATGEAGSATPSAVRIQSQHLDNSGSIAANQLALNQTRITNSGHLLSAGEAQIQANTLHNSGQISGARLAVDTPFLHNSGTLQQTGLQGLALHSAQLNNSGKIGYPEPESSDATGNSGGQNGNAQISPAPSTAQGGGSVATHATTPIALAEGKINVQRLDNTGNITANGGIDLSNTAQLNNQGQLNLKQLTAMGETLNNAGGKISAQNAAVSVAQFHNRQGQVAAEQMQVHSQRLDNTHGSLDAQALQLSAHTLDNSNGAIRSDKNTQLALSGSLKNQQGQISSAGAVSIQGHATASPTLDNDQGSILAGEQLSIQAQSLTGKGEIASGKDADIALQDDFITENNFTAGHKLTLRTEGNLTNRHQLHADEAVVVAARQIDNQAGGVIQSGQSTQLTADNITNRGLINSNGLTHVGSLNTLTNTGTGRIYGDHVALSAQDVVNREETVNGETKAGVIAARQRLDIGAKTIQNLGSGFNRIENGQAVQGTSSLISSEGTLHIGGQLNEQHQAVGTAEKLENRGARIETGGDAFTSIRHLQNKNLGLTAEKYLDSQNTIVEFTDTGSATPFFREGRDGWISKEDHDWEFHYNDGRPTRWLHKYDVKNVWKSDYTESVYKQRVLQSTPAEIVIGGNLHIIDGKWENRDSQLLIGGAIIGNAQAVDNVATDAIKTIVQKGSKARGSHDRHGGHGHRKIDFDKNRQIIYSSIDQKDDGFNVPVAVYQTNVHHLPATQNNAGENTVNPNQVQPNIPSSIKAGTDIVQLPNSSLYSTQPNNPNYLIETDPAFTNYRQWLGSDYLLNALGLRNMHKRLGDGYYEQKLVNEQIARLTGYRRLDGYDNDEDQLKALMDAGITFARSQQLVPGVALSAAQVAQLTSDIVWLENQTVTLKDGSQQTVLVPKVYVVARKGDLNSTGSLISANVLQLNADEIRNGGTIAGRKVVDLRAQNIEHSGQIRGEKVWLDAQNQINLQGGDIAAGKLLSLSADQINVSSTTATSGDKQNGNTVVDRVARLSVGDDGSEGGILSIQSKHDTQLNGAVVRNTSQGGKTQIISEHGNVDLGTVATERHESYGNLSDKNHRHVHQTAEVGTDIQSQGDLLIKAGNDIKIRQGNLDSEKGLTALQAGRNIQISEGRSTLNLDEAVYTKSRKLLSKSSQLDTYQRQHDEAQGSSVTGKTVYMNGDNIRAVGSSIVSDELTVLDARKDIDVQAATSRYHDIETSERKKSGFAASVSHAKLNVGYNKSRSNVGHDADLQVAEAAQIGSLKGHTVLTAGNHVQVTGSNLLAGKDIDIQAKTVDIDAASLLQQENLTQSSKSSGFNVGINLKPGEVRQFSRYWDGIKAARNRKGNVRDKAHTWEKNHLAGALEPLTPSVGFSLTRNTSSQSINETRTEATGSKVQAGGVVRIHATDGDINIKGSNVFGKGGLQLHADNGEIHNLAVQETSNVESSSFNKTSGIMNGGGIAKIFIGNKTETSQDHNSSIQEVASTIGDGSPAGSVFTANGYTQIGSNLLSGGHVDIYAKNIQIKAGEATQRNDHHYTFTQKGITVGVNAPIVQAIDSAQSAVRSLEQAEQSGKQRTQAMAVANAGMQAYQASQAINKMGSGSKGGSKGGSNGVSISVTYGEQRNQSHSEIQDQQANASRILAEGQVRLHATGSGKDSNIKIEGSDVIGKQGTFLFADNQIDLLAAEQHHSEHHRNKNEGWNAGVAVSADKGASLGFTAGGNLGKGHADGEQTTYRHSHVGSAGSPTVIVSGGDTNIKGAQVTGKGITVRAANLNIESLQDTADYRSRQQNISAQVTVGYGASASGDYSQSKINAEHRSVSEQSGLFAGEDGFDVQVGGHTQLTGGIITSAQSAEAQGKNRFQSGSISQTDLHNISKYDGSSIGFGASVALSGETLGQGTQNNSKLTTVADKNSQGFNGVGYGRDSDHQESTTHSGIGTRNIILTDEAGQLAKTGYGTDKAIQLAYTDIRSEDAQTHSGSLKNRFDASTVQNELDLQRNVSQQFSQTVGTAQGMLNEKIDALKQQQEAGKITKAEYAQKLKQLQHSQVFLNMVAAALSAPTDSAAGIAAATAAPAISYGIGQEFKKHNKEGSPTHIASHMALGAVVSALGGNDAVSGALAAGGAEALVPLFSKAMYGTTDPEKLTAEDKQNLSNMARLFGAAVGAATSNGAANGYADVAQGSLNAGNAVENNGLTNKYGEAKLNPEGKALNAKLVQAGVKSADFYHDLMIKCGNNNECINQVETAQDKAELESGKVVLDLYHNGKLSTHELDTYLGKYSDTMMRGAAEGEGKNRNNPDAYSMNAANWTPAGVQSNPYLNQLIQEYHLDKLRKNGASEKEIRNHVEQYQAISRYVSSEFNSTVAIKNIMTLKAAQLTPYLVIKLLTRGKGVAPNTNITNVNPSKQSSTNNKNSGVAKDGQSFGNLGNPNPNNLGATKVTSSNAPLATNSKIGLNELQKKYPNNSVTREGGNWLPTRERVNQNIHELRKGREAARNGLQENNIRTGKYPDGISFASNLKDHLSKGEGLIQRSGVSGAHNKDSFMKILTQHNGRIIQEETISRGITRITYEYPKFDGRGNPIGFKKSPYPKTVYDPKIYSDKDMLEWGQKAAAKGYHKYTTNKNAREYSEYYNGIKFRVYVDKNTGVINNVHPE